jgi:hypothetical protein
MPDEFLNGVAAPDLDRADLMREAGVQWVRMGAAVPFADRIGGARSERYDRARSAIEAAAAHGFQVMGVTPGPGVARYYPDETGRLTLKWRDRFPEWFGPLGSEECLDNYAAVCAWLARDLKGLVRVWQVANELDWKQFSGPMTPQQSCDLIIAGARALKGADASLLVGHNLAGIHGDNVPFFLDYLFDRDDCPLDYCGVDGYYGSWHKGGPDDWADAIDTLHQKTGRPVLVNEWGFASAGGVKTDEDRRQGLATCACHRWPHTWGPGHTPEGQARFVEAAMAVFAERRAKLLGQFYFRWSDQPTCWQCGEPDCPAETAWGLVDLDGNPKPSFDAYRDGVQMPAGQGPEGR